MIWAETSRRRERSAGLSLSRLVGVRLRSAQDIDSKTLIEMSCIQVSRFWDYLQRCCCRSPYLCCTLLRLSNPPLRRAETPRLKVSMYFERSNPNVLRIRSWGLACFVVIAENQCWQPKLEVINATVLARFDPPHRTLQHPLLSLPLNPCKLHSHDFLGRLLTTKSIHTACLALVSS
jgi:hypothetical protein